MILGLSVLFIPNPPGASGSEMSGSIRENLAMPTSARYGEYITTRNRGGSTAAPRSVRRKLTNFDGTNLIHEPSINTETYTFVIK